MCRCKKKPLLFEPLWKKIYGTTLICFRSHFVQKDAALIFQMRFMYEWDCCIFLIHVHNTLHTHQTNEILSISSERKVLHSTIRTKFVALKKQFLPSKKYSTKNVYFCYLVYLALTNGTNVLFLKGMFSKKAT